jgi:hypothetical protein
MGCLSALPTKQFGRKSKRRAWLAIDVRCLARVVWEIGLQDAAAGAHMFYFCTRGWQEPLLVTLRGRGGGGKRVESTKLAADWGLEPIDLGPLGRKRLERCRLRRLDLLFPKRSSLLSLPSYDNYLSEMLQALLAYSSCLIMHWSGPRKGRRRVSSRLLIPSVQCDWTLSWKYVEMSPLDARPPGICQW